VSVVRSSQISLRGFAYASSTDGWTGSTTYWKWPFAASPFGSRAGVAAGGVVRVGAVPPERPEAGDVEGHDGLAVTGLDALHPRGAAGGHVHLGRGGRGQDRVVVARDLPGGADHVREGRCGQAEGGDAGEGGRGGGRADGGAGSGAAVRFISGSPLDTTVC
jgi:hypothetical protein